MEAKQKVDKEEDKGEENKRYACTFPLSAMLYKRKTNELCKCSKC